MAISNEICQKFSEALCQGVNKLLGKTSGSSWLTPAQCRRGHVQFTESMRGGQRAADIFAKKVEELSPAVTHCGVMPLTYGSPATYSIGISFDPSIVEALYSDGANTVRTFEKGGKKYVLDDSGNAVEVEDPDKYVKNLNQSTGSNLQKKEGAEDILADLRKEVEEANLALDGTGVEVALEGDKITLKGDAALVKPTQSALPDPVFGLEDLEGGYNKDAGAVEVIIPKFADTRDVTNLSDFLTRAVNIILDIFEKGDFTPEDEWGHLLRDAEEDPVMASRYAYAGESFVGDDKAAGAKLIKSLMVTDFNEAKKVAVKLMGPKVAEALMVAPKIEESKKTETRKPIMLDEETALLDSLHEAHVKGLPKYEPNV